MKMNPTALGIAILLVILALLGGGVFIYAQMDETTARGADQRAIETIEARVTLKNTCGIGDEFFVVVASRSGRRAQFANGEATIVAQPGEELRLEIASGFPEVKYAGYPEKAAREVDLIADCASGERQQMINRSMRDAFGN
jgi:hypothetical protein